MSEPAVEMSAVPVNMSPLAMRVRKKDLNLSGVITGIMKDAIVLATRL